MLKWPEESPNFRSKSRRFQVHFRSDHTTHSKGKHAPTMRQERAVQSSVFDLFAEHEIGRELKAICSGWTNIATYSGG